MTQHATSEHRVWPRELRGLGVVGVARIVAVCETCGWQGPYRESWDQAGRDSRSHRRGKSRKADNDA